MSRTTLSLLLIFWLPLTVSAKKYAPAQWTQFADAPMSDVGLQILPKETIHLGNLSAKKATVRSSKPGRTKKRKGSRKSHALKNGSPLKIQVAF